MGGSTLTAALFLSVLAKTYDKTKQVKVESSAQF